MALRDGRGYFAQLGDPESNEVYRRIYESVLEHRLRPGVKLPEERLAALFDVSRAKVRKVLARLEHEQIIETIHNRGAYVAQPTPAQASDTLEARRVIEPAIVEGLADRATAQDVLRLRRHVEAEFEALARDDKPAMIRLAGEYHNVAAELAGNTALARVLRELSALTCLTILLYDAPTANACLPDDHVLLNDAIERRDGPAAAEIMLRHLKDVENSLVFEKGGEDIDLASIFG